MNQIAVIEDNPDNRLLVRVILEPQYEVTEYETGFAGLEGLRGRRPDLVLLDISLPEMDGTDFCSRVRAREKTEYTYFILVTAAQTEADGRRGLGPQPARRDIEGERGRVRDVEALDCPGEVKPCHAVAGGARQLA